VAVLTRSRRNIWRVGSVSGFAQSEGARPKNLRRFDDYAYSVTIRREPMVLWDCCVPFVPPNGRSDRSVDVRGFISGVMKQRDTLRPSRAKQSIMDPLCLYGRIPPANARVQLESTAKGRYCYATSRQIAVWNMAQLADRALLAIAAL